jgi:predicted ATPase
VSEPLPHLEYVLVEHFGCIERVALTLTRLHALVGPNDSGKSTVLDALRLLGGIADPTGRSLAGADVQRAVRRVGTPRQAESLRLGFLAGRLGWAARLEPGNSPQFGWHRPTPRPDLAAEAQRIDQILGRTDSAGDAALRSFPRTHLSGSIPTAIWGDDGAASPLPGSRLVRLDPDAMRAPAQILTDAEPLAFRDERGAGLAAVIDAIATRDHEAYSAINRQLTDLFPALKGIHLTSPGNGAKALGFRLVAGTVIPAEQASEGMLYALAFLVLQHLEPVGLLLVEEPENGLHPARIREMVELLRRLSERQQVVMATHSPLVLNELEGEEISVVTRPEGRGSRAMRLSDTPRYAERARAYRNGELWIAYCDGVTEHDLLEGIQRDWEAP